MQNERAIKAENAQLVRQLKDFDVARNRKNREEIRQRQKNVSARFEKQREAHQEFLAQDFINMIALEDQRREQVERAARLELGPCEMAVALRDGPAARFIALQGAYDTLRSRNSNM